MNVPQYGTGCSNLLVAVAGPEGCKLKVTVNATRLPLVPVSLVLNYVMMWLSDDLEGRSRILSGCQAASDNELNNITQRASGTV